MEATDLRPLLDRISGDEGRIVSLPEDALSRTYLRMYPELIRYFADLPNIEPHHVVVGVGFTYRWLPCIVRLHTHDLAPVANSLNRVKAGFDATAEELQRLVDAIGNSVVAVSKLLHFVNPRAYPICDSRVIRYLRVTEPRFGPSSCKNVKGYARYVQLCRLMAGTEQMRQVQTSISHRLGYEVTAMRAIELVMFLGGAPTTAAEEGGR